MLSIRRAYRQKDLTSVLPTLNAQVDVFRTKHNVAAASCTSRSTKAEKDYVSGQLAANVPELRLLYVTPEQLGNNAVLVQSLRKVCAAGKLVLLAVDEAHCVLDWGARTGAEELLPRSPVGPCSRKAHDTGGPPPALSAPAQPCELTPPRSAQATTFAQTTANWATSEGGSNPRTTDFLSWRGVRSASPPPPTLPACMPEAELKLSCPQRPVSAGPHRHRHSKGLQRGLPGPEASRPNGHHRRL